MQLRRFTGDSMPKALGAVREALGDGAIILSNRRVDGRIEIVATATLDERALAAAEPFVPTPGPVAGPAVSPTAGTDVGPTVGAGAAAEATPAPTPRPAMFPAVTAATAAASAAVAAEREAHTRSAIDSLSRDLAAMSDAERPLTLRGLSSGTAPAPAAVAATPEAAEPPAGRDAPRGTPAAPAAGASVAAAPVADGAETRLVEALGATLERTLASLEQRQEVRAQRLEERLRRLEINLWGELEPLKAAHLRQLLGLGLGAELAVRLVERIEPGMTPDAAMRRSLALLKATLPIGVDDTGRKPGVTVLSGPAGGGKTTALVKLATRQVQREGNQSVVMIAADNRRIGAFESLQVYGRLLGVPVVQAHDADELTSLIEAFAHKPLVLIDHVPLERGDAMPLPTNQTLGTSGSGGRARTLRHLLVLPATLESRAFEALVADHAAHGVTHGVLTRLDRSARLGAYFAPLVRHQLPIAYWSDSARVQTPLEKADASVLVATAMATGARLAPSEDERCLLGLLQPTRRDVGRSLVSGVVAVHANDAGDPNDAAEATAGAGAVSVSGAVSGARSVPETAPDPDTGSGTRPATRPTAGEPVGTTR